MVGQKTKNHNIDLTFDLNETHFEPKYLFILTRISDNPC